MWGAGAWQRSLADSPYASLKFPGIFPIFALPLSPKYCSPHISQGIVDFRQMCRVESFKLCTARFSLKRVHAYVLVRVLAGVERCPHKDIAWQYRYAYGAGALHIADLALEVHKSSTWSSLTSQSYKSRCGIYCLNGEIFEGCQI